MTTPTNKRKLSVSLDEDLVSQLEASGESVSAQINSMLRDEVGRRRRRELLRDLLERWDREFDPPDEELVQEFVERLG